MGSDGSAIHNQLLVPFAGLRNGYNAVVLDIGASANLRSSSPHYTYPDSHYLVLGANGSLYTSTHYRIHGFSVRCVYDSYETYTPA